MENAQKISNAWYFYLIDNQPMYAYAYEDGDRYVRAEYMIQIENQVKDIYIKCLENNGNYNMPPSSINDTKKLS